MLCQRDYSQCYFFVYTLAMEHILLPHSAWLLEAIDTSTSCGYAVIYASHENTVACWDPELQEECWQVRTGGKPLALATQTGVHQEGSSIYAACADGKVYAWNSAGRLCWTYDSGYPVYAVCVFSSEDTVFIACGGIDRCLTILTLHGQVVAQHSVDAVVNHLTACRDGVVLVENHFHLERYRYRCFDLQQVWSRRLHAHGSGTPWENVGDSFTVTSLEATYNEDGQWLLALGSSFANHQAVQVIDEDGHHLGISAPLCTESGMGAAKEAERWYEFYAGSFVRWARRDNILVLYAVSGGNVRCLTVDGTVVWEHEARIGFAALLACSTSQLYLGSCPDGDTSLYVIDLEQPEKEIAQCFWQGKMADISANLIQVSQAIQSLPSSTSQFSLPLYGSLRAPNRTTEYKNFTAFKKHLDENFEKDCFAPYTMNSCVESSLAEKHPELILFTWRWEHESQHAGLDTDDIIALVCDYEKNKIPVILRVAHSCQPLLSLEMAERLLQAAPQFLLGFISCEEENPSVYETFYKRFMGPLIDLCSEYQRQCISLNKGLFWLAAPALPAVYEGLYKNKEHATVVAAAEDSNSRTPELNLMGRVGLKQLGLIKHFEVSVCSDMYHVKYSPWNFSKHGHGFLRSLLCQCVLGASHMHIRIMDRMQTSGCNDFTRLGKESTEIIGHLFRSGILYPIEPSEGIGFSRLGLVMHSPNKTWLAETDNMHRPHQWFEQPYIQEAVLPMNGCTWSWAPTPAHSISAVLFRKQQQAMSHIPATPYGPVLMVPEHAPYASCETVDEWLHTDGIHLWADEGTKLCGPAAAALLRQRAEHHAHSLPVRALDDDVFIHTINLRSEGMRIYLIDPDWLTPSERTLRLIIQQSGDWRLHDAITGQPVALQNKTAHVTVPAGLFRIIDCMPVK